jgi:hypothetical protein
MSYPGVSVLKKRSPGQTCQYGTGRHHLYGNTLNRSRQTMCREADPARTSLCSGHRNSVRAFL